MATAASALFAACDPSPPPAAIDAAALHALLQRLDRVAAALEAAPRIAPAATTAAPAIAAPAERAAVAGDATALQARVGALEAELAVLRAQPAAMPAMPARPAGFVATPPMRAASVQSFKELMARDEQQSSSEAFRSVFLLGPAQVLERFGTPSNVFVQKDGACLWCYEGEHAISIRFAQGAVIAIY